MLTANFFNISLISFFICSLNLGYFTSPILILGSGLFDRKIYPFQVPTLFQGKPGKAKCEQARAIIIGRFEEKLGELTEKEMNEIEEKLVFVLHLENLIKKRVQLIVQKYLKLSKINYD